MSREGAAHRASIVLSGLVLAGGRSTRMGRDKALLETEGVPMWQRQRDILAQLPCAEIFVSARPDQTWAYAASGFAAVLNDALPDCGPIVGVTAALERASHGHVAVLAIDLPRMPAAWFATLRDHCAPGVGAVGRKGDFFEPLAAIYPQAMKWLAWEALAAGTYSLQSLLRQAVAQAMLNVVDIPATAADWFQNWNRHADAEASANGE